MLQLLAGLFAVVTKLFFVESGSNTW